jgi:hypothetical protein
MLYRDMKRLNALHLMLIQLLLAATALGSDASSAKIPVAGSYQIRNKQFGDLLRPENANGAVGTRIVLYPAQPWKCMTWKVQPAGESGFQLQNYFTSKTFAAEASTEQPEQRVTQVAFAKPPGTNPMWQIMEVSKGIYEILEAKTGKALTAVKVDGGVRIVVCAWQDKEEQKWELVPIDPSQLTM